MRPVLILAVLGSGSLLTAATVDSGSPSPTGVEAAGRPAVPPAHHARLSALSPGMRLELPPPPSPEPGPTAAPARLPRRASTAPSRHDRRQPAARRSPPGGAAPGGAWACIRQRESGGNYSTPGGGAYQFLDSTWHAVGGRGRAENAPPPEQDARARQLQRQSGWSQWSTASACGVR